MMEILATVLGVCFVALVMLSLCRAAARADAMAQHDWRVFCDEKARKARLIQRRNAVSDQCGAGLRADGLRKCRSAV